MNTKYIRLLSYENGQKLIDFIAKNFPNDYAYVTMGGLGLQVSENNWKTVEDFIKSLADRYEISNEHPYKTQQNIVNNLRNNNIID